MTAVAEDHKVQPDVKFVPLDHVEPSGTNPAKRTRAEDLADLVASVREHGILQPVLLRPLLSRFVIVAGHRRCAAAKAAGLTTVPAIVRKMSETEALELQLVENLQRADLHPLEEAEGYHQLSRRPGYDVAKIAARLGRSPAYIYDRMKLLSLTKDAKAAFLDGKFAAGHAILLARLGAADQARALDPGAGALYTHETELFELDEEPTRDGHLKPRSVREFNSWIDRHVRFDGKVVDQFLFPETASALEGATANKDKVVAITFLSYIPDEAREGRTFFPQSWARADGKEKSKPCDYSVLGFVAAGPRRGESFRVCVNKDRCETHWGALIRKRQRRQAGKPSTISSSEARQNANQVAQAERAKKHHEQQERMHAAWRKALPEAYAAVAAKISKAPCGARSVVGDFVLKHVRAGAPKAAAQLVPPGSTPEELIRHLAMTLAFAYADNEWQGDSVMRSCKALGVDLAPIVKRAAAAPKKSPAQTSGKARRKKAAA